VKCQRCGSTVSDGESSCPACGQELDTAAEHNKNEWNSTESGQSSTAASYNSLPEELNQIFYEIKVAFKPVTQPISEHISGDISLRNGMISGVIAYVAGLFTVVLLGLLNILLAEEAYSNSGVFGQDNGAISIVMESGIIFYSAHNSVMNTTGVPNGLDSIPSNYIVLFTDFLAGQIGNVADVNIALYSGATFSFKLFYIFIPAIIFISGYTFVTAKREENEPSYISVIRGASLTAGYLPLAVIGSFVFSLETPEVTWTPKVASSLLMVGILYPISFGSLGGAVASIIPKLKYSLKSSMFYGFLAGMVSVLATLLLTFFTIDSTSADIVEMLQTGLILYAYSANYTIPGTPTYGLPKFLFGLLILGSTVLAGSLASRKYRTSLRKSIASGVSISVGFSMVFIFTLYLMLFPFQIEPVIVIEDDLLLQPVKMWMYGGIIYPALIGGVIAGIQYYRQ